MFLSIDIGNTNITTGVFYGDEIQFVSRIKTDRSKTPDEYAILFKQILSLYKIDCGKIVKAGISSVVPEISESISTAIQRISGCSPVIISSGSKCSMPVLIDNPLQLGADLMAGCVAASKLYPLPCLVIDLGTASKISAIDKNGAFRGCAIAPGIGISLEALSDRTSQLPSISLKTPSHSIGTNTHDSMQSGTVFGFSSMIDGLCDRFEKELGEGKCTCVATGGLAEDIVKSCSRTIKYNGELILYGIKTICEE